MGLGGVLLSDMWSCSQGLHRDGSQSSITVLGDHCRCLQTASLARILTAPSTVLPKVARGHCEHLSRGTALLCSHPSVTPTPLGVGSSSKPTSLHSHLPLPCSLCSSLTGPIAAPASGPLHLLFPLPGTPCPSDAPQRPSDVTLPDHLLSPVTATSSLRKNPPLHSSVSVWEAISPAVSPP